jgi:hypothetical protein
MIYIYNIHTHILMFVYIFRRPCGFRSPSIMAVMAVPSPGLPTEKALSTLPGRDPAGPSWTQLHVKHGTKMPRNVSSKSFDCCWLFAYDKSTCEGRPTGFVSKVWLA